MLEEQIASLAISEPPEVDDVVLTLRHMLVPRKGGFSEEVNAIQILCHLF